MAKQRAVIRLELEAISKKQIDDVCEKRGMTQIAVLSRMVKWFYGQDELLQAAVLGLLSEDMLGDVGQTLHRRMVAAASGRKAVPPASGRR